MGAFSGYTLEDAKGGAPKKPAAEAKPAAADKPKADKPPPPKPAKQDAPAAAPAPSKGACRCPEGVLCRQLALLSMILNSAACVRRSCRCSMLAKQESHACCAPSAV